MAERNTTTVYRAARTLIQDGGHIPPVTSSRVACKRSIAGVALRVVLLLFLVCF